jgi:UDP-N-acetylglucosamine 2-epimerase
MKSVFTYPNADTSYGIIISAIEEYCRAHTESRVVKSAGSREYFDLMRSARAMVGNSSSGIIEAASFKLPVVNIGNRQRGRIQPKNVINCGPATDEIVAAIGRAMDRDFTDSLKDLVNPYGDGKAAMRIADRLLVTKVTDELTAKRFVDL